MTGNQGEHLDHTTPRECPKCGKICKGASGLGGHLAWHNKHDAPTELNLPAPKRKYTRRQPVQTKPLDAVDICSATLDAMALNGTIPTVKLSAWFRWVKATQTFLEEMNGNN